ncbi:MAG: DsrE family protein [Cyclobacteriaceae bacterium]|nr:DsrE family protein [Cyclobacteriaceae bacterium]UYN85888.1 MAG: DsrE family protein [Cyclobacteriaceae bacterium]
MKNILLLVFVLVCNVLQAQQIVFPVVRNFGGIYDIPDAVERPDPTLDYKIVIDLAGGSENPAVINDHLNNIARMINLHGIGGVPKEKIKVVVAIHNQATYSIMDNESYNQRYKVDNPNLALYKALREAGVELFVCGQSLIGRNIDKTKISPDIKIATSMLTVLTTYQLKGYAWFKF